MCTRAPSVLSSHCEHVPDWFSVPIVEDDIVSCKTEKVEEIESVSMFGSIANLFKNIVATSMLTMPYGVSCAGVVPSILIGIIFALLSSFTFAELGRLCALAKVTTYRGICEKYISKKFGVYVEVLLAMYTFPSCISYSIFLISCFERMASHLIPEDSVWALFRTRWLIGLLLTVLVLLPLCSISKLHVLTYTSILGIAATIYCFIFVAVDLGASDVDIAANIAGAIWGPPSGSLLGIFPMANIYASLYLVHYNAPKFCADLIRPTRIRVATMAGSAMGLAGLFCCAFSLLGFARWGVGVLDNILMEYTGAYIVWVATCVSIITTYPFVFDAGRRSLISIFGKSEKKIFWTSTFVLVPLFSIIAVFVNNLALIVGLNGAIAGMTVGFSLPGFLMVRRARLEKESCPIGWGLVSIGIALSVLGVASIFIL